MLSALKLWKDERAAVAPTVALSLIALIAAGGIAFDYARLAALDTELQNAADQAALAAATQLDQTAGTCGRASAAAVDFVSNQTRFANDGGTPAITIPSEPTCDAVGNIRFWQNKAKTTASDADGNAFFVEVTVNGRTANYALTPIVNAFSSGVITATAFAGMGSAICKVPPLMMCSITPGSFDPDNYRGYGLNLFQGGGSSWFPGGFGYMDVGATNNGSPDQRIAMGMDLPNTTCITEDGAAVDTGVSGSVLDALNVRFDIFQNGWGRNTCYDHPNCSPAYNTTKDFGRNTLPSKNSCGVGNNEWRLASTNDQYIPTNTAGDDPNVTLMGYPMDICHYPVGNDECDAVAGADRIGNGSWRRDIYFKTNHPALSNADGSNWQTQTGLPNNATRYDFYQWEQGIPGVGNGLGTRPSAGDQRGAPVCKPPGLQAGSTQPDRRVIAIAVVDNCDELSGGNTNQTLEIGTWAEVFLTQPSLSRPDAGVADNEIYAEIIGEIVPSDSGADAQVILRDVPYLIE